MTVNNIFSIASAIKKENYKKTLKVEELFISVNRILEMT